MYFLIQVIGPVDEKDSFNRALTTMDDVKVKFTSEWEEARDTIIDESPQIIIIDEGMIQARGESIISQVRNLKNGSRIYVIAKCPTVELAVGSVKSGADEFFTNPPDLVKFRSMVKEEVEEWRLQAFGKDFFKKQRAKYDFSNIYGESNEIKQVFQLVKKIIPSRSATVLIRGETGTGKGLIARTIHYNTANGGSIGVESPFVEINCTAIPENLLESELFGYEKGAFTDAKTTKKGLFELADGGTIFLDEIGQMNHNLQVKLLKVVEERIFRRLGGTRDIKIDVRILAGTNKDLEKAITEGKFRKDLYYRLNVFTFKMPLLKDRGDDIKLLAQRFLELYNKEHHRDIKGFTEGAIDLMMKHSWPGNVRELKNAVERSVLMVEGDWINEESLPIQLNTSGKHRKEPVREKDLNIILELGGVGIPLETVEKEVIEGVLKLNKGNRSKSARVLQISRPRLLRMIKKYDINV
jgi:DNA-binding NtrC family response regulator